MASVFRSWLCLISLLLWSSQIEAQIQHPDKGKKLRWIEKGVIVGMGYGQDNLQIPEGLYMPCFGIMRFAFDFAHKSSIHHHKAFYAISLEPQFNVVLIKANAGLLTELETGLNIGFQHFYPLSNKVLINTFISAGPHYISVETVRLAKGFSFSDNFGMGLYYALNDKIWLNIGFRLRHLSNAEIQFPNAGINTYNFHVGISRLLR